MSIRDLESELLGLAGHIAAAQCRFLQLLAEFDSRDGWAGPGLRSCAHWLSWRAGMSLRTAVEHLRVAHALRRLPRITEAFAAGRISYSKVRAITRIAGGDDPATAEHVLLNLALSGTASHVETVVRAYRRRTTPPADLTARRGLSWRWDEDGCLVLRGRLAPAEGAALIAAIDALVPLQDAPVADEQTLDAAADGAVGSSIDDGRDYDGRDYDGRDYDGRDYDARDYDARDYDGEYVDGADDGADDGPAIGRADARAESRAARRADALLALVTGEAGSAAGSDNAAAPVVARGRAQVLVHLDVGTGEARIDGGPEIPAATAERLACDARVRLLLDDRTRNRLYLGRSRRLATRAQIAALVARDGARCQFPGCPHTRFLHAHHVRPWLRGGRTDIDNLILTCSYHHGVIHDYGYEIYRRPHGWDFRRRDGSPIPAAGPPPQGDVESLIDILTGSGPRITRDTLTPTWGGERLDPMPILDTLLPRHPTAAA